MPYKWKTPPAPKSASELQLWPHQSLPPKGFAAFIGATFVLIMIPLFPLIGSVVLWGVLPFLLLAVGGVWLALERSHRNAQILEVLTLSGETAHLVRHNPRGPAQEWDCNIYWAQVEMHKKDGPVPHYVTLRGEGREVEIGAFLSEEERISLYDDLLRGLAQTRG
ncbi:DUF2244 domain-containing protein [Sulfitobacter sp. JL08]|jgi:uncharacterized membrane protein|uniref:DUF2244 domain-containing protein n=1 Tax=Sulfitobacter sp. JL08 TaxID=2070369 RepID=UPI000E0C64DF|nr:DUF2244 domain-containing protein [Sulfitobacter sp. JL08]AXI54062.1 DUF2244 domain-containing protein [Sulfitobacter sp. JL08]